MNSRLKILTPLLLLLTSSAVMASTASASQVTTAGGAYPTVLTGAKEGGTAENYVESTPGNRFHCSTVTGEATITGPSTTVLVTPHLAGCKSTAGGLEPSATFHPNGCTFEVTAGETTSPTQTHGSVNVACPAGKKITVTIATCQVHIGPQEIFGSAALTNLANGKITVSTNTNQKLHYEETDGFLCPFQGNTTGTEGTIVGQILIAGYNDEGTVEDPVTPGTIDHKHSPTERAVHVK
jgi:hypothetical protein